MPNRPDEKLPVHGIALRTGIRGPMKEVREAVATRDGGLEGDVPSPPDRGITFLASKQWEQANRALGTDLPWHTRRANVLVDADALAHWVGRTVRLGRIEVRVMQESKPCAVMDELHPGLRAALRPDGRGGVAGRIIKGGSFKVGDVVTILT